jgi:hypothetical protein
LVRAYTVRRRSQRLYKNLPHIKYWPTTTNGMPQSQKKVGAPVKRTPPSQTIANPPHMKEKGMRKASVRLTKREGSGRPVHRIFSPGCR